ncbi:MAG: tRNA 2-thiocytidine(32) synthetase TtcA [SAR86 cluster bacterium]|uniref:tRNA-cytidine(32) 2-sulfurtransferase n=1 Tax=SAR86 cluster bacterium TaxID=2030880 RepID=A0A2A5C6W6_9GAMM|nr:tRNA 2-thiocytidine(32) synthetase TtcA [bacterium AH-315-I11]PCJ39619.1 MAG: tRNA 2-thiocytidine(32) synthetase TtcA [SAR86 cluster bacterium]
METSARKNNLRLNQLQKSLRRGCGRAIADFNMIEEGDLVMVCLSGGKDSYVMLDILLNLQKHAPINFAIHAVNLDQKQPGFPEHVLPEYLDSIQVDYHIIEQDTYSVVVEKTTEGKSYCGLCSRLRRGSLYSYAKKIGASKIALGHHRHDLMETLFLNMFFGGKLKAMPPKLLSDDKQHIVIRPLAYCKESEIAEFADYKKFPIIPCTLCGNQKNLQRQEIKKMLNSWEEQFPGRLDVLFKSITNIAPSHLADNELFDFKNLEAEREQSKLAQQSGNDLLNTVNLF